MRKVTVNKESVDKGVGTTKEAEAKQEIQDRKWHVHCPVCGCKLGRSKRSDSDMECHKCHSTIGILVSDGMVTVVDRTERRDSACTARVSVYIEKLSQLMDEAE